MVTEALQFLRQRADRGPLAVALRRLGLGAFLLRMYERRILGRGMHQVELLGTRLRFAVSSGVEITHIDINVQSECEFLQRLLDSLAPGDVLYDVGANIGIVSMLAAKHGAVVHAFEPEPRNFAQLHKNVHLNGLEERITMHAIGLGDCPARVPLFVEAETGDGRHSIVSHPAGRRQVLIDLDTADNIAASSGRTPNVVKIDVEGAEMHVLRGMTGLLSRQAVRDLFVEIHPQILRQTGHLPQSLRAWLARFGYAVVWSAPRQSELHEHYKPGV